MTEQLNTAFSDWTDVDLSNEFPVISMPQLYASVYLTKPPLIEGLLYRDSYIFAGSPKQGKSFLMLQLCYHVSMGMPLWGHPVNQGTVLYLALEDDYARLQQRLFTMFAEEASEQFYMATWAKKVGEGLEEQLIEFVKEHPETSLIVIDTLKLVRALRPNQNSYDEDYEFGTAITRLVRQLGVCIIVVHHTTKMKYKDIFDNLSGTKGLYGSFDAAMVLEKPESHSKKANLYFQGRDQIETMLELEKDMKTLQWLFLSESAELWKKPPDPVLDAVSTIVSVDAPCWSGTATDLVTRLNIEMKPNQLSIRLNVNAQRLVDEYQIRYSNTRSHAGRKITLQLILEEA